MQTTTQAKSLAPIPTPRAAPSRARRAFTPAPAPGPYRLPHAVRDRLTAALAPFRNREAAFALAVFLARFWSVPGRVAGAFPIDRRALTGHDGLALTEARVRGAIRTLEAIGFLDRALSSGSRYRVTEEGLQRRPVLFGFGTDYAPLFLAANRRAAAARGRPSPERRVFYCRRRAAAVREPPSGLAQVAHNQKRSESPSAYG
jgi:hypothetical protein